MQARHGGWGAESKWKVSKTHFYILHQPVGRLWVFSDICYFGSLGSEKEKGRAGFKKRGQDLVNTTLWSFAANEFLCDNKVLLSVPHQLNDVNSSPQLESQMLFGPLNEMRLIPLFSSLPCPCSWLFSPMLLSCTGGPLRVWQCWLTSLNPQKSCFAIPPHCSHV